MKTTDPLTSALERIDELATFYDVAGVTLAGAVALVQLPGVALPVRPRLLWAELWPLDGKLRPNRSPVPTETPVVMIVVSFARYPGRVTTSLHASYITTDRQLRRQAASMVDVVVNVLASQWERQLPERA